MINDNYGKIAYSKEYSIIIAFLSILLSFYYIIYLFRTSSLSWIYFSISIYFSIISFFFSNSIIYNFLIRKTGKRYLAHLFLLINSFLLFISSTLGYLQIIKSLDLFNNIHFAIGSILFIMLLLSSSIGLYHPNIKH